MPWKETSPVNERLRFVLDAEEGLFNFKELYGISRQQGYKWLRRYEAEGPRGLEDRSRRPRSCPHKTSARAPARDEARTPQLGPQKAPALPAETPSPQAACALDGEQHPGEARTRAATTNDAIGNSTQALTASRLRRPTTSGLSTSKASSS